MDRALTNVIQDLIIIDHGESSKSDSQEDPTVSEDLRDDLENDCNEVDMRHDHTATLKSDVLGKSPQAWTSSIESWCPLSTPKTLRRTFTSNDLSSVVDQGETTKSSLIGSSTRRRDDGDGEIKSKSTPKNPKDSHVSTAPMTNASSAMPVFSIGPFPTSTVSSTKSVQFSNPLIMGPSNRFFAPVFGASMAELEDSTSNFVAVASNDQLVSCQIEDSTGSREQRLSKLTENVLDSDSVSVDSSSSLDTVREFPMTDRSPASSSTMLAKEEPQASASSSQKEGTVTSIKSRTPEEVLAARADRLKRLEEQADWLVKKMNATSKRGSALCTRLEELHETYGEPPVPPPMPDVLPSRRLPSSLPDLPRQVRNA